MFFSDVIGQEKIKERLIRSVQEQHISHALLFSGEEGIGKLALALAYAKYVFCKNPGLHDSCGICPACRKVSRLVHPDLHFVFPVIPKKSDSRTISDEFLIQWREFVLKSPYFNLKQWLTFLGVENAQALIYAEESSSIIRKLSLKSFEAEFKIMVIWLPEKMHPSCANKLLKMIEEPPDKTLFLMVTENEADIIPTIRSRTQIIRVPRIEDGALQQALQRDPSLSPELIAEMVHHAGGNYLKALEYHFASEDNDYFFKTIQQTMRLAFGSKINELVNLAEELSTLGRERQKDFFRYALYLTREYFVMNFRKPQLVYLNRKEKEWGNDFSPYINERNVVTFSKIFSAGINDISRNGNSKIIFTDALLKIVRAIRA